LEKIRGENISGLSVWIIAVAALSAVSAKVPVLALGIPVTLTYMMVRFNAAGGISGVAAMGAAAVFSPAAAIAFAAAFVPVSVAASIVILQKRRFRDSVLIASGAALAGAVLFIGVLWLRTRTLPVDYMTARIGQSLSALGDSSVNLAYQAARYLDIQTGAITQEAVLATPRALAIDTMMSISRDWINYLLVTGIAVYSLLCGLACYLIPRSIAKRRGMPVKNIPAFSDYELPRGFWAAFLVSYLAAAIGYSFKLPYFDLLSDTVFYVYAFVFMMQALSFTDFLFKSRGVSAKMRVALQALALIVFGNLLMWLGIFENIIQFRRRSQEKGGADI
jgi:hypothetical protein